MVTAVLSLREDYWEEYELEEEDISYLYDYLLENETPLTSEELMPILVKQRISVEKVRLEKKRLNLRTMIAVDHGRTKIRKRRTLRKVLSSITEDKALVL